MKTHQAPTGAHVVVRYYNGMFCGLASGHGINKGTDNARHSLRVAEKLRRRLEAQAIPGEEYQVEYLN